MGIIRLIKVLISTSYSNLFVIMHNCLYIIQSLYYSFTYIYTSHIMPYLRLDGLEIEKQRILS